MTDVEEHVTIRTTKPPTRSNMPAEAGNSTAGISETSQFTTGYVFS